MLVNITRGTDPDVGHFEKVTDTDVGHWKKVFLNNLSELYPLRSTGFPAVFPLPSEFPLSANPLFQELFPAIL